MRNQYKGNCFKCSKEVLPGDGFFQSVGSLPKEQRKGYWKSKWLVRCEDCIGAGN
jgi:hypothetical protein